MPGTGIVPVSMLLILLLYFGAFGVFICKQFFRDHIFVSHVKRAWTWIRKETSSVVWFIDKRNQGLEFPVEGLSSG